MTSLVEMILVNIIYLVLDFVLTGTSALGVSIATGCEVGVGMFFTLVHLYSRSIIVAHRSKGRHTCQLSLLLLAGAQRELDQVLHGNWIRRRISSENSLTTNGAAEV